MRRFQLLVHVLAACCAGAGGLAEAAEPLGLAAPPVLGARLRVATHLRAVIPESERASRMEAVIFSAEREEAPVLVRFVAPPSERDLMLLEARIGIRWHRLEGRLLLPAGATVVGGSMDWDLLGKLAAEPAVMRVELATHPLARRPLYGSPAEVGALVARETLIPGYGSLRGDGIIVADFDSGADLYAPTFFRADGGRYAWIDVDGDGAVTPELDAVDLDGSGTPTANATLRALLAPHYDYLGTMTAPSSYRVERDYLYLDDNNNGVRDHGPAFADAPAWGEPIFVADDGNGDGLLGAGEMLVRLGTSKFRAALDGQQQLYRRGVDLHLFVNGTNSENGRHGTGSLSVVAGGWPGLAELTGIAPGVDLIVMNSSSLYPGFGLTSVDYSFAVPAVEAEGANIVLHELGWWVFDFMDGSSLNDVLMTESTDRGVLHVTPAGNLAGGGKHAQMIVDAAGAFSLTFEVPGQPQVPQYIFMSLLWADPGAGAATFSVVRPDGTVLPLGDGSGPTVSDGSLDIYLGRDLSPRGTARFDAMLIDSNMAPGSWSVVVDTTAPLGLVNGYVMDTVSSWGGGVGWSSGVTDVSSVVFPATSDDAFAVGSSVLRNIIAPTDVIGGISYFSGRGPSVDGRAVLDIVAPGHFDIVTPTSERSDPFLGLVPHGATSWFGGTSAAGPHVAGAAALLMQAWPALDAREIADALRAGALADGQTASVPNDTWGWGKLRIDAALAAADDGAAPVLSSAVWVNPVLPAYRAVTATADRPVVAPVVLEAGGVTTEPDVLPGYVMSPFFAGGAGVAVLRVSTPAGAKGTVEVTLP